MTGDAALERSISGGRGRRGRVRLANSRLVLFAAVATARFLGRYSERLAAFPAYLLWFIPWKVPVSDRGLKKQAKWLEPTRPFVLSTSEGRIVGFTAGDGPLVMLVHGLGERAAALGGFITPLTDAGFTVVGIDLPGHGESGRQMTNPIISATAVREVASRFGGAYAVIAHSLGSSAALWAMKDGLAAERAVLIAPTVDMGYALTTFKGLFGLPDKAIAGLKRKIERRYGPAIWHELSGEHLSSDSKARALVFHDPDDDQVPFEGSERLVRAWEGAELIEAPGLGHGSITRDPAVIERAVAFLRDATPKPAASRSA